MIPVGALAALAIAVARASAKNAAHPDQRAASQDRIAAALGWLVLAPFWLFQLLSMRSEARVEHLIAWTFTVVTFPIVFFPSFIAEVFAVPRGHPRLAHVLGTSARWRWADEREGAALVLALLALRARAAPEDDPAWDRYAGELLAIKRGVAGPLLAAALLAEHRGDRARARVLLEAGALLPFELGWCVGAGWMRARIAAELCAEGELFRAARLPLGGPRWAALLVRAARTLTPGWDRAEDAELRPRTQAALYWGAWPLRRKVERALRPWLITWQRRMLRDRAPFERILAALEAPSAPVSERALEVPSLESPEQRAVLALARARAGGVTSLPALDTLGDILDEAAEGLDAEAFGTLLESVREATAAVPMGLRRAASSWVLQEVFDDGEGALRELEALGEGYDDEETVMPLAVEVENWATLRVLYERALAESGDPLDPLAFQAVRAGVWDRAARLFNGGHRELARAMYYFLREEGLKRNDVDVVRGMAANLRL
jgi:hypothetical protein